MAQTHSARERTVSQCEAYLDLLADIHGRAGNHAASLLPLVRRIRLELEALQAEESDLTFLLRRSAKKAEAKDGSSQSPNNRSTCVPRQEMEHQ
jgi:hypothetical protein